MIKQQMLNESKTSGWMADFGEYLPMDAILFNVYITWHYHEIDY